MVERKYCAVPLSRIERKSMATVGIVMNLKMY